MSCDSGSAKFRPRLVNRVTYLVAVWFAGLLSTLHGQAAGAFAIYTVGGDAACGFSDVQAAVDAAGANPGDDYVWIANNKTYSNEQINVSSQDVIIEGGFTNCSDFTISPADSTTLNGATGGGPVFSISGTANVVLSNLTVTGAHRSSNAEGGGIFYGGSGSLTLSNMTVTRNSATYGAGIDVSPSGATTVTLMSNTLIITNTADISGGGIRIEGDTHLVAVSDETDIAFNTATSGYGGGILVLGPARADIGSPGYFADGVINNNTAAHGGGLALFANQGGGNDPVLKLFTTVADRPVSLQGNIGTVNGGAVYAKSNDSSDANSYATFCGFDARIDGNSSPEGAAIYLDFDTETFATLDAGSTADLHPMSDGSDTTCGTPPPEYDPVSCAADSPCNELSGNVTRDGDGNPTSGALIFVTNESTFNISHTTVRQNTVAHLIHGNGGGGENDGGVQIHGSLFVDNVISSESFSLEDTGAFIAWTTIAHNFLTANHVFNLNSSAFTLHDVIIGENGPLAMVQAGSNTLAIDNVLSNDITTLPASSSIVSGDPMFVNVSSGDYHLLAYVQEGQITASRAIDFAATVAFDSDLPDDLDGNPYDQDVNVIQNLFGARDLGAYEMQPINDRIFGDAFGDRLSLVK
jgi:hypothetical protein